MLRAGACPAGNAVKYRTMYFTYFPGNAIITNNASIEYWSTRVICNRYVLLKSLSRQ